MMTGSNNKNYHSKGISLKLIGILMIVFGIIVSGALITSLWLISYENTVVTNANNNYIALKQASNDIQSASDDLTNDARLFVANADKTYMNSYFFEVNVTKRRENGLNTIHELSKNTFRHEEIHSNIEAAVNESMDLMNLEFYAMKLICVEYNISCSEYPQVEAINVESVPPEQRKSEALNSVLGTDYIYKKEIISSYINTAVDIIDQLMHKNGANAASNLNRLIVFQTIVIVINVLFMAALITFLYFDIVRPLNIAVNELKNGRSINVHGNREFNYLVDTYNDVRSQNEKVKEKLVYEAEHDKLTGLYNRAGYVALYRRMKLNKTAYILLDADGFKKINDKYGHEIGDKVLIRVAETLERHFSEDNSYVFRLGGDEFAILIENIDDISVDEIMKKCSAVNGELSTFKGKIPPLSLSIGVARGEIDDTTDSLFKKADLALYNVKHHGKSGVEVY